MSNKLYKPVSIMVEKNQNLCKKNVRNLSLWTFAWVVSLALVTFGHQYFWEGQVWFTLIAIILNAVIGFGMILANKRYLTGLDELQRKINLEAMGITLGVGLVAGLSYSMLDVTNLIDYDAEISHLVVIMAITYLGSILYINSTYR